MPLSAGNILVQGKLPAKTFADRMQIIIKKLGSQEKLGDACGISGVTIGKYASGKADPSRERLVSMAETANVNVLWLATGEGEMEQGTATAEPVAAAKAAVADPGEPFAQDAESEELCRLLKRYGNRALVEDVKARLLKIKAVVEG